MPRSHKTLRVSSSILIYTQNVITVAQCPRLPVWFYITKYKTFFLLSFFLVIYLLNILFFFK